jgi:hypothetical protein
MPKIGKKNWQRGEYSKTLTCFKEASFFVFTSATNFTAQKSAGRLVKEGIHNWRHSVKCCESSNEHISNFANWIEIKNGLSKKKRTEQLSVR